MPFKPFRKRRAFSLIELAALLVVVGLALSTILSVSTATKDRKTVVKAIDRRAEIADAIDDFLDRNGRYPCVASFTQAPATATFGREILADCTADTSTPGSTLRVETAASSGVFIRVGAVPVRDLLLDDEYMEDGYGNRYTYVVMEGLTNATTYDATSAAVTVLDAAGGTVTSDAAYALLSHGKDGKGAYRFESGSLRVACGATANLDVENCDGDATLRLADYSETATAALYYDDLLQYAPKGEPGESDSSPSPSPSNDVCVPQDPLPTNQGTFVKYNLTSEPWVYVELGAADITNDGIKDIVFGMTGDNPTDYNSFYLYGNVSGWATPMTLSGLIGNSTGFSDMSAFGQVFDSGDINGDGKEDIAFASTSNSPTWAGITFGKSSASFNDAYGNMYGSTELYDPPNGFRLVASSGDSAQGIAVGDVNGDGYDDVAIVQNWSGGNRSRVGLRW